MKNNCLVSCRDISYLFAISGSNIMKVILSCLYAMMPLLDLVNTLLLSVAYLHCKLRFDVQNMCL